MKMTLTLEVPEGTTEDQALNAIAQGARAILAYREDGISQGSPKSNALYMALNKAVKH